MHYDVFTPQVHQGRRRRRCGRARDGGGRPGDRAVGPEIRWRLTASWPKSLDTLYGNPEYLAKRVAELTDNKFQIQVFAAGEIVPGLQVLDAVQAGNVEAGHTAAYYYFGKDVALTFGTDLPFGLNSRMKNAWFFHGGGQQLFDEFLRTKYGVTGFISGSTNCQMGGWFRKEINTLDDLKGLKFRVGGFAGLILQRVGVVPQQIAGGEFIPHWRRARSMRPSGLAPTTTKSSAS